VSGKRALSSGMEKQNTTAKVVHDACSATGQDDLRSKVIKKLSMKKNVKLKYFPGRLSRKN
jgi:hypothetical protein